MRDAALVGVAFGVGIPTLLLSAVLVPLAALSALEFVSMRGWLASPARMMLKDGAAIYCPDVIIQSELHKRFSDRSGYWVCGEVLVHRDNANVITYGPRPFWD